MRYLVNVGTEKGNTADPDIGHDGRAAAIRGWLGKYAELQGWMYHEDAAGENTVVLDLSLRRVPTKLHHHVFHELAEATQQDCVAVWDCVAGKGSLIGPRSIGWEPFDGKYFKWNATHGGVTH